MDRIDIAELREKNKRALEEGRAELTRRMMTMPLADPVQKWREEADERERQRKAERAEIERGWRRELEHKRAANAPPPLDVLAVEAILHHALERERAIRTEAVGEYVVREVDQSAATLRREFADKLAGVERERKVERAAHEREIAALRQELSAARTNYARDLAALSRDISTVGQQLNQLGAAITGKKLDGLRDGLADEFSRLRADIGDLKKH